MVVPVTPFPHTPEAFTNERAELKQMSSSNQIGTLCSPFHRRTMHRHSTSEGDVLMPMFLLE